MKSDNGLPSVCFPKAPSSGHHVKMFTSDGHNISGLRGIEVTASYGDAVYVTAHFVANICQLQDDEND